MARGMNRSDVTGQTLKTAFLVHSIWQMIHLSYVTTPQILVALLYFERMCNSVVLDVSEMFCERVFFGCLILASKVRACFSSMSTFMS